MLAAYLTNYNNQVLKLLERHVVWEQAWSLIEKPNPVATLQGIEVTNDDYRVVLCAIRELKAAKHSLDITLRQQLTKWLAQQHIDMAELIEEIPNTRPTLKSRTIQDYLYWYQQLPRNKQKNEDYIAELHRALIAAVDFIAPYPDKHGKLPKDYDLSETADKKDGEHGSGPAKLTKRKKTLTDAIGAHLPWIQKLPAVDNKTILPRVAGPRRSAEAAAAAAAASIPVTLSGATMPIVITTAAQQLYGASLPTECPERFSKLMPHLQVMAATGAIKLVTVTQSLSEDDPIGRHLHGTLFEETIQARLDLSEKLDVSVPLDAGNETRIDRNTALARTQLEEALRFGCEYIAESAAANPRRILFATRPPGHHAADGQHIHGFCIDNNAFAYLLRLLQTPRPDGSIRKIVLYDTDIHDGDGTRTLLENLLEQHPEYREQIRFINPFSKRHFPFTFDDREPGVYDAGCIINIPFIITDEPGAGHKRKISPYHVFDDAGYIAIAEERFAALKKQGFIPTDIIVSLGVDGDKKDVMEGPLTEKAYAAITRELLVLAPQASFTAIMEGGYYPEPVKRCVSAVLNTLCTFKPSFGAAAAGLFGEEAHKAKRRRANAESGDEEEEDDTAMSQASAQTTQLTSPEV